MPTFLPEIWNLVHGNRDCLHNYPPIKTLVTESLVSFPERQHFNMLSQLIAGEIKNVLCDSTGRGLLEVCTCFPLDQ